MYQPLADELRPTELDDVCGQEHILGPGGLLRRIIESGRIPNMIFYGPSGVGKTTLLRLILGLEKPDSGKITGVPGKKSAVFQESRLIPELTIRGNLRLVLGNRFPETEITAMLTRLDLTDCLDTPAANLSGGQQRRSALARALLYGGELLVLDEPFTGLDEDNRRKALDTIRAYPKEAIVLLVTHSREDAEALGAEIIEI